MPLDAWEQLLDEDENNLWFSRFLIYLQMGPKRTYSGALRLIDQAEKRPQHDQPYGAFKDAVKTYHWAERAEAYDAYMRKTVFTTGYAHDLIRIEKLNTLADKLEEKVVVMLEKMKPPKGGFSEKLVERYLQVVEALASETGGRKKGLEVSGPGGGPISAMQRVVFFSPQVAPGEDIDMIMPPPATEGSEK